jgi:hypothetical protein
MGDTSSESGADQPALPSNHLSARWPLWLAVFLFCFAGASVAYFTTKPLYRSDIIFEFSPTRGTTQENLARSAADLDFASGQAYIARSDRVVGAAMNNRAWKALGRPATPRSAITFAERVEAQAIPGGALRLSFYDADAKAAQVGAGAVGEEYGSLYRNSDRLDVLYKRQSLFASDVARLHAMIIEAADEFRGADLAVVQTFWTQEALRLEREMHNAETAALVSTTRPSTAPTRPLAKVLAERHEAALAQTRRAGAAVLKVRELDKRREAAEQESLRLVHRTNELSLDGGHPWRMTVLQSAHLPLKLAIDHRVRNAAWSALGSFIGFFILRRIWRTWRERRRVVLARTAFPLIITHTPKAKPVIPIEAGAAGGI